MIDEHQKFQLFSIDTLPTVFILVFILPAIEFVQGSTNFSMHVSMGAFVQT